MCIYTLFVHNKPGFHLMNENSAKINVNYTSHQYFLSYRTCACASLLFIMYIPVSSTCLLAEIYMRGFIFKAVHCIPYVVRNCAIM